MVSKAVQSEAGGYTPPVFLRVEIPIMEQENDKAARAFRLPDDVKEARLRKVRAKLNHAHPPLQEQLPESSYVAIGKWLSLVLIVVAVADMLMR